MALHSAHLPVTHAEETQTAVQHPGQISDRETPKGTLTILLLYAALMVALWGYAYWTLLARR